jgi:ornithine decarboxylase
VLDIGGGFPVDYLTPVMPIEEFCAPIRAALEAIDPSVRVIAEPGRFIAGPAAIAVASVMGRALRDGRWWYYLDDGLYGSYSGQLYDHTKYPLEALVPPGETFPRCSRVRPATASMSSTMHAICPSSTSAI